MGKPTKRRKPQQLNTTGLMKELHTEQAQFGSGERINFAKARENVENTLPKPEKRRDYDPYAQERRYALRLIDERETMTIAKARQLGALSLTEGAVAAVEAAYKIDPNSRWDSPEAIQTQNRLVDRGIDYGRSALQHAVQFNPDNYSRTRLY